MLEIVQANAAADLRRKTMKWTVTNQHDGNDTFEAEGDSYGEAACDALQQLGWAISIPERNEEEDTPNAAHDGRQGAAP